MSTGSVYGFYKNCITKYPLLTGISTPLNSKMIIGVLYSKLIYIVCINAMITFHAIAHRNLNAYLQRAEIFIPFRREVLGIYVQLLLNGCFHRRYSC